MGRGGVRVCKKPRFCVCKICNKEFTNFGIGSAPTYCSDACKAKSVKLMRGKELTCQTCGQKFLAVNPDAKYCSKKCYGQTKVKTEHYRTKFRKVCAICKNEYETRNHTQKTCSPNCGRQLTTEKLKKYQTCQHCGKPFWRKDASRMKYCSRQCFTAEKHARTAEKYANDPLPVIYNRVCHECSTEFSTKFSNKIYCSKNCTYNVNLRLKRKYWSEDYTPRTFTC